MPSNIGSREVRTATKDMASGVERGRSWGEVRAEGAKGGAVCSKGNPVGFVDGVSTGRSPEGTIADFKNRFYGGPRRGRDVMIVVNRQGDAIDSLQTVVCEVKVGTDIPPPVCDGGERVEMRSNSTVEVRGKPRVRILGKGSGGEFWRWKARPSWEGGEVLVVNVREIVVESGTRKGHGSSNISQFIACDANVGGDLVDVCLEA